MSTRYWIIVKRTDGKFARLYTKSYNDRDYVGAMLMVDYPDQATAEAGFGESDRVEVFDDLQTAWDYEDAIDFVFVWRDGKWFVSHPEHGPEALVEMTRDNQPRASSYADQIENYYEKVWPKDREEFWCEADAERKLLDEAFAQVDAGASKADRLQIWTDLLPRLKLYGNMEYAALERQRAADPDAD